MEDEYLFLDATAGREAFIELHDRLHQGLLAEHLSTAHAYRPHITIGRIQDRRDRETALAAARGTRPEVEWEVKKVSIFELS